MHGCCTENTKDWDDLRKAIEAEIHKKNDKKDWKVVVWNWTKYTPPFPQVGKAYANAQDQGINLARAIKSNTTYKYIHLIGHSAGAKLINEAALVLSGGSNRPFIHSTFLDAYTPSPGDHVLYGVYSDYAEHYVFAQDRWPVRSY